MQKIITDINGNEYKQCSKFKKGICANQNKSTDGWFPVSEFIADRTKSTGLTGQCKACNAKRVTDWFKANPKKACFIAQTWRDKHPIKAKRSKDRFAARNPDKMYIWGRESSWQYYGVHNPDGTWFEWPDWLIKLNEQKGVCATCPSTTKLGIDHNHKTGIARGILCDPCNLQVGCIEKRLALGKSINRKARKYVSYLKKHNNKAKAI